MKQIDKSELSFDEFDEANDPRPNEQEFDRVVERAISRRGFLGGVVAFGSGAVMMGASPFFAGRAEAASRFGFTPIPTSTANTITLPEGYNWQVLVRWGDPLWSDGEELDMKTGGTAASQAKAFGDNTDGMFMFVVGDKQLLAINNEYIQNKVLLQGRDDGMPINADDASKIKAAHGVSIIEVSETDGKWSVVKDSPYNRRITMDTPMTLTGPAAGDDRLKTAADPEGRTVLGTNNNCGAGITPWGTYLTCEENFNGYYGSSDPDIAITPEWQRYGINTESRYQLDKFDDRFDLAKTPNETNRYGYIVEIDPSNPDSTPIKRTALGRFKHENAEMVISTDGHAVVYLGDDERGEFLYRYVSNDKYVEGGDNSKLLDEGKLYVAKFNDDQTGEWVELNQASTGMSSADIAIFTRMAASKVGATTMDRPEWVAVNPGRVEAYVALTNNKNRGLKTNAGGDWTPVNGPNPREANNFGQILRWRPENADHAGPKFTWDIYVMAGNPDVLEGPYAGSENVNSGNMFNSPDCVAFDQRGFLWILTDGDYSNGGEFAGQGNNQLLIGDPASGEIARFMVGPTSCEVTGLTWSADRRTAFVGIQHPGVGENGGFPDYGDALPRSSVIAIRKNDGSVIG